MPRFTVKFLLAPPWVFGLPDGRATVIPASPTNREVISPSIDTRTGKVSGHGTLSEYRPAAEAVQMVSVADGIEAQCVDNFFTLKLEAADAGAADQLAGQRMDLICQGLSVLFGTRFSAQRLSIQDEAGTPQRIPTGDSVGFAIAWYNLDETRERVSTATAWAGLVDERARKALLYYEHARLLAEFADTLPAHGAHATFSHGMALLQLFKGVSTIVGEPSVDRDYQSRAISIGLPKDFWITQIKPLYVVRNEEDLAHYTLNDPDPSAYRKHFGDAVAVFRDAFTAYMRSLGRDAS